MGRRLGHLGREKDEQIVRLVADHHPVVYGYAFRLCGSNADAEDLAQEAFLLAHQKIDQLRDPSKARPWLLAIVRNCFLKELRRPKPTIESNLDLGMNDVAEASAETVFDIERLQDSLDRLPEEFRVVVLMHYFEFLSYREIAEALDTPIGTIMSRLARAKRRLRAAMTRTDKRDQRSGTRSRRKRRKPNNETKTANPDP